MYFYWFAYAYRWREAEISEIIANYANEGETGEYFTQQMLIRDLHRVTDGIYISSDFYVLYRFDVIFYLIAVVIHIMLNAIYWNYLGFNMWFRLLKIEMRIVMFFITFAMLDMVLLGDNLFFNGYFVCAIIIPGVKVIYEIMRYENLDEVETFDWDWIELVSEDFENFIYPLFKISVVLYSLFYLIIFY